MAVTLCYFAFRADRNITAYDNNFQVLGYSLSNIGTTHTVYNGSQTGGRVRAQLHRKYGLKFVGLSPSTTVTVHPESHVLLLRYRGDLPFEELDGLSALLRTDNKEVFHQLQGANRYDRAKKVFTKRWLLPQVATRDNSLRIDFYLSSEYAKPIATLRVRELIRHNQTIQ